MVITELLKYHVQVICNWWLQQNWNKTGNASEPKVKNYKYFDKYFVKPNHLLICSMFCSIVMTVDPIWMLSVCSKCKKWSLCRTKREKKLKLKEPMIQLGFICPFKTKSKHDHFC